MVILFMLFKLGILKSLKAQNEIISLVIEDLKYMTHALLFETDAEDLHMFKVKPFQSVPG